jgi:N utilization substance protein B
MRICNGEEDCQVKVLGEIIMSLSRNDSRVLAMTVLYQVDLFKRKEIKYNIEELIANNTVDIKADLSFVKELVYGVINHNDELVNLANLYLNNWNISRLGLTDGAILKIAIYEMLYTDTPNKVCIDEAIELAHDFSDEKVVGMLNGVLDKIYHENTKEGSK